MTRPEKAGQLRLFGTVDDMHTRLRNVLQRLPRGEYGMGQITPYLIRSHSPAEATAFAQAVHTLAKDGLVTLKLFQDSGWTVPGLVNRIGRYVEPSRKKKR